MGKKMAKSRELNNIFGWGVELKKKKRYKKQDTNKHQKERKLKGRQLVKLTPF